MGPLQGYKIIELGAIGPGPFCAMMLSDMGAEVIRLDRIGESDLGIKRDPKFATTNRGRRSIAIDLKSSAAIQAVLRLVQAADALIEGFRPGVMERLGLGPAVCLGANPKLVYGRMTGWGQTGPLAQEVGHDINYLAIAGALHSIGREGQPPSPPLNLVGDLGGGALYLAFGIVCALLEVKQSGQGQVVDAAMVDGIGSLLTGFHGMRAAGIWRDTRGGNFIDSGAPWYDCYETKDGKFVSVGAIEGKFYNNLLRCLGLLDDPLPAQFDREGWPELRRTFAQTFRQKTCAEWCSIMAGQEACFAPVLDLPEAASHSHQKERTAYIEIGGILQPAPAPRYSRSTPDIPMPPKEPGADTDAVLSDWGFSQSEVEELHRNGAIR